MQNAKIKWSQIWHVWRYKLKTFQLAYLVEKSLMQTVCYVVPSMEGCNWGHGLLGQLTSHAINYNLP